MDFSLPAKYNHLSPAMCKSKCQNSYNSIENIQNHSPKKNE